MVSSKAHRNYVSCKFRRRSVWAQKNFIFVVFDGVAAIEDFFLQIEHNKNEKFVFDKEYSAQVSDIETDFDLKFLKKNL